MNQTKTEKVLRKIIYFCSFLVFLLPLLIVNQMYLPFIFPKTMVFRLLVEIMLVCFLMLLFSNWQRYWPKRNGLLIAITSFLVAMIISTIFSVESYTSFWGTMERMEGLLNFFHHWLFFIMLITFLKTRNDWLKIFNFSIVIGLLIDIYSVLQRLGWSVLVGSGIEDRLRVVGTIGNPAFLAAYLLLNCILILVLLIRTDQKWLRWVYWFIFLFNIVVIYMTNTRGELLALIAGFVLFVILYFISFPRSKINKYFIVLFLIIAMGTSLMFVSKDKEWVKQNDYLRRISETSLTDDSVKARLMAWEIGWQAFKEKPLVGWGPENYNIPFNKHFKAEYLLDFYYTVWYDRAHNVIVETATTMGILGLAGYLSIFIYLIVRLFRYWQRHRNRTERLIAIVLITGLAAYFIQNIFIFDTINSYIMIFLIFAYISFVLSQADKEEETIVEKIEGAVETAKEAIVNTIKPKKIKLWLLPIILVILAVPFIRTVVYPVSANRAGADGKAYFQAGLTDKGMEMFKKSFEYDTFIQAEILDHAGDEVSKIIDHPKFDEQNKIEYLHFIIEENEKMINRHPLNVRRYINTSKNYARLAMFENKETNLAKAIELLEKAIPLSPKRQRIYNELAFAHLRLGHYDETVNILNQVIETSDHIPEFRWNLFLVHEEIGNLELAAETLAEAIRLKYPFHKNIGATIHVAEFYTKLEEYEKAIPFYKQAVEQDKNPQWYIGLATLYAKVGNYDAAIMWAYRLLEVQPISQNQVKEFIADLESRK